MPPTNNAVAAASSSSNDANMFKPKKYTQGAPMSLTLLNMWS